MSNNMFIPKEIIDKMTNDKKVRKAVVTEDFMIFFHFYFSHYIKYPTADFQKAIITHLDKNQEDLFVVAFRGSGKSTIVTTAYPIWAMSGKLNKRFILIICQTKEQAKIHMNSIKQELEYNSLLKKDLGPFKEESGEWTAESLRFTDSGAKIMVASIEQSIRGLRNNENRPDLIILDDIEDMSSTRTRYRRDKTYNWLKSELIPAGDRGTRLVAVGNLLHEDSLLKRIEEEIKEKKIEGKFMTIPIIDESGKSFWPGKYPSEIEIQNEKKKIGNEVAWRREYLLEIVSDFESPIFREWIQYYGNLPSPNEVTSVRIAIDPAISEKSTADCTAMVVGICTNYGNTSKIHIHPLIINEKMNFPKTIEKCRELNNYLKKEYPNVYTTFYVEDVGYQRSLVQTLRNEDGFLVESIPTNVDKRYRLSLTGGAVLDGRVLFPTCGAGVLIDQIVNFGTERYDDLADAFSNLVLSVVHSPTNKIGFY